MIRSNIDRSIDHDPHFHWRGKDVTRIENLSDIVFALALSMLVISADPIRTFEDLQAFLLSIVPVAIGFLALLTIWHKHYTFFRRFGVVDNKIILFNACLLFCVMYIAYPLRFAFDSLFSSLIGPLDNYERIAAMRIDFARSGVVVAYFAVGYSVIHGLFTLMYRHALKKKDVLELTDKEQILSKRSKLEHMCATAIGMAVAVMCAFTPLSSLAAFSFILNWPAAIWVERKYALGE